MRLIELFEQAHFAENTDKVTDMHVYKKYVTDKNGQTECTVYLSYVDENGVVHVDETLPFQSVFIIADNADMKALYATINNGSQLFDVIQFTEYYDKIRIFRPRDDAYNYEVQNIEMSKVREDIFKLPTEYNEVFIVDIVGDSFSELEKIILMT